MDNSLRTNGWDGPLGWPDIDPSKAEQVDITSYTYYRTANEKAQVNMSTDQDAITWAQSTDKTENAAVLAILSARYQLDDLWEKLTRAVTSFSSKYLTGAYGSQALDINTTEEYDNAMGEILTITAYISTMNTLYTNIDKSSDNLKEILLKSERNTVYENVDGAAEQELSDIAEGKQTGDILSFITGIWNYFKTPQNSTLGRANKMTITDSMTFFSNYEEWAKDILNKLQKQDGKTTGTGDVLTYSAEYPRHVVMSSREQNMKKFAQDIQMIDSLCSDVNVRSTWIFLQIGNMKFSTWDDSNYIVNFDFKKNGSGMANSFTFDLAYTPPPGDTDINKMEKILSKRKVFFQFGYNELENVCSPQYQGQILSYTAAIENNTMKYTLVGYSDATESRTGKITIPSYGEYYADETDEKGNVTKKGELAFGARATEYAAQFLEIYLGRYNYKVVIDESAYQKDKKIKIEQCEGGIFEVTQQILSQAVLEDEVAKLVDGDESKETESDDSTTSESSDVSSYFTFEVDDCVGDDGKKTISIIRLRSKKELQSSNIAPSVAFTWGGDFNGQVRKVTSANLNLSSYTEEQADAIELFDSFFANSTPYSKGEYRMLSNMIVSFSTQYQGEVTLARAYQDSIQYRVDKNCNLIATSGVYAKNTTGDTALQDERYSYWLWERNTIFSYNATLQLLGVPTDIPIGTYLYIKPVVNGVAHHTAGFYFVTGSEDKITQQGYTTTVNLIRIVDKYEDETLDMIDQLRKSNRYKDLSTAAAIEEKFALKKWMKENNK